MWIPRQRRTDKGLMVEFVEADGSHKSYVIGYGDVAVESDALGVAFVVELDVGPP